MTRPSPILALACLALLAAGCGTTPVQQAAAAGTLFKATGNYLIEQRKAGRISDDDWVRIYAAMEAGNAARKKMFAAAVGNDAFEHQHHKAAFDAALDSLLRKRESLEAAPAAPATVPPDEAPDPDMIPDPEDAQ